MDKVSEVLDIAGEEIEDPPSFGADVDTKFILGMGKSGGQVTILLDIDHVLSGSELADISSTALAETNKEQPDE